MIFTRAIQACSSAKSAKYWSQARSLRVKFWAGPMRTPFMHDATALTSTYEFTRRGVILATPRAQAQAQAQTQAQKYTNEVHSMCNRVTSLARLHLLSTAEGHRF